ncbi:septum formation initiator family protein [Hankyongella ginsenosidimutans]|uniref:Septum formation initiator family protein n=1 Tax=Hankyongella ginsenosidimutans TaxID=1763828 RepID=A0A4D7BSW0_9SPHN|nr:septum formation initiator family protein [Hankyongella ginsenosidimutans]QCI78719.1 septum formation initiator family protein [Hankyongella ginsenosidimutans]
MELRTIIAERVRQLLIPALCLLVMAFFGYHAVFGSAGIIAAQHYARQLGVVTGQAERLAVERATLERRIALLNRDAMDRDYADELARRVLGLVGQDEYVVSLPPQNDAPAQ